MRNKNKTKRKITINKKIGKVRQDSSIIFLFFISMFFFFLNILKFENVKLSCFFHFILLQFASIYDLLDSFFQIICIFFLIIIYLLNIILHYVVSTLVLVNYRYRYLNKN